MNKTTKSEFTCAMSIVYQYLHYMIYSLLMLCVSEILGVLLSVVSIWAVTAALVISAVQRIIEGDYDIDSRVMLITSGCAVGVNIL